MEPTMTTASHSRDFQTLAALVHPLTRWLRPRAASASRPAAWTVSLQRHETRALANFECGTIECIDGCIWLTHDGDCRDVLLEAGQSHVSDRGARLLIHAVACSAIRLMASSRAT
jgi:Protein of unknown function (DUF2917)